MYASPHAQIEIVCCRDFYLIGLTSAIPLSSTRLDSSRRSRTRDRSILNIQDALFHQVLIVMFDHSTKELPLSNEWTIGSPQIRDRLPLIFSRNFKCEHIS